MRRFFIALVLAVSGCAGIPENVTAVSGFDVQRYLGTWYEIARLDHSFERGLSDVTATYSLREDGALRVINKGFNKLSGEWDKAEGKAWFVGAHDVGRLKVSFFGPFYGGYNIIALDKENYSWSLVCGPDRSYLWILAREKQLDKATIDQLLDKARQAGFAVEQLIFVDHGGA